MNCRVSTYFTKEWPTYFLISFLWIMGIGLLRFSGPLGAKFTWSILGYTLATGGMLWCFYSFQKVNPKHILWFLCALGILSRLLFVGYPVSDDFYRYTWEGFIQEQGFNPYLTSPEDPSLTSYRDATWEQINHKEYPAIYPPVSMLAFRALADFYPSPEPWRFLLILSEIITGLLLILLIRRTNISLAVFSLFALNPYILVFSIGEAHLDTLQLPFLIGALYFFKRSFSSFQNATYPQIATQKKWNTLLAATSMLLLGLSIFVKFWTVFCIPAFIHKKTLPWIFLLPLPALLYGLYLPETSTQSLSEWGTLWHSIGELLYSLRSFSQDFTFNNLFHGILQPWLGSYAHWIGITLLISVTGIHLLLEHRIERNILFILIISFIVAPTVHPWYLLLATPFVTLTPSRSLLLLTTLTFYALLPMYTRWWNTGFCQEYTLSQYCIWIPFFLCLWWEWKTKPRSYALLSKAKEVEEVGNNHHDGNKEMIQKISVVLPTWNEEERIDRVLHNIASAAEYLQYQQSSKGITVETIVVDGGSQDDTVAKAQAKGAIVLPAKQKGRGYQIAQGLEYASGDITLFLHADCTLPRDLLTSLVSFLEINPHVLGGCHTMQFHSDNRMNGKIDSKQHFIQKHVFSKMRIIQWLNNFRAQYLHIAFGDQVQFVRTQYAKEHHLVQGMPLMEDLSLSLSVQEYGRFAVHSKTVQVSTRKWEKAQFSQNTALVLKLVFLFLVIKRLGYFIPQSSYFVNKYYKSKG
jgi:glycosyltransferase involved in cell wall biosynthesis